MLSIARLTRPRPVEVELNADERPLLDALVGVEDVERQELLGGLDPHVRVRAARLHLAEIGTRRVERALVGHGLLLRVERLLGRAQLHAREGVRVVARVEIRPHELHQHVARLRGQHVDGGRRLRLPSGLVGGFGMDDVRAVHVDGEGPPRGALRVRQLRGRAAGELAEGERAVDEREFAARLRAHLAVDVVAGLRDELGKPLRSVVEAALDAHRRRLAARIGALLLYVDLERLVDTRGDDGVEGSALQLRRAVFAGLRLADPDVHRVAGLDHLLDLELDGVLRLGHREEQHRGLRVERRGHRRRVASGPRVGPVLLATHDVVAGAKADVGLLAAAPRLHRVTADRLLRSLSGRQVHDRDGWARAATAVQDGGGSEDRGAQRKDSQARRAPHRAR